MSDKSQPPTGVFVRLPLSAEQEEACFEISERDCLNAAIAAIGTPVDSSVPIACWASSGFQKMLDTTVQCRMTVSDRCSSYFDLPLVRQSDHQAALAAAQAEIVRLREIIKTVDGLIMGNNDPIKMFVAIHSACQSALKGPEA